MKVKCHCFMWRVLKNLWFKAHVVAENMNWTLLRESLLNMLLVCLPEIFKFLIFNFMVHGHATLFKAYYIPFDFSLGVFLQGSRKIIYKVLMKDCLSIMCNMSQSTVFSEETSYNENSLGELLHEGNSAITLALPEVKKSTCTVLKKFFLMVNSLAICLWVYTRNDLFLITTLCIL